MRRWLPQRVEKARDELARGRQVDEAGGQRSRGRGACRGPADVPLLLAFIRKMAEYEKLDSAATEASLRSDLFGDSPAAHTLLAFVGDEPVGYAIYFFSFSSMMGRRALWLEDLFIDPPFRGKGIGQALMAYLAHIALEYRCTRLEWIVLDWNTSAIEFYRGLGADVLPEWRICRVDESRLSRLASGLEGSPKADSSPGAARSNGPAATFRGLFSRSA